MFKSLAALSLIVLSISAFANLEGKYKTSHKIPAMFASASEADCKENGGEWEVGDPTVEDDGMCLIKIDDTLTISMDRGIYKVNTTTYGSNLHSCSFSGDAKVSPKNANQLIATGVSEEYIPEKDKTETAQCVVTVTLGRGGKNAYVSNNGKCRSFCGANAWLESYFRGK